MGNEILLSHGSEASSSSACLGDQRPEEFRARRRAAPGIADQQAPARSHVGVLGRFHSSMEARPLASISFKTRNGNFPRCRASIAISPENQAPMIRGARRTKPRSDTHRRLGCPVRIPAMACRGASRQCRRTMGGLKTRPRRPGDRLESASPLGRSRLLHPREGSWGRGSFHGRDHVVPEAGVRRAIPPQGRAGEVRARTALPRARRPVSFAKRVFDPWHGGC